MLFVSMLSTMHSIGLLFYVVCPYAEYHAQYRAVVLCCLSVC